MSKLEKTYLCHAGCPHERHHWPDLRAVSVWGEFQGEPQGETGGKWIGAMKEAMLK